MSELVTIAEHDQGWIERAVTYRNGENGKVRLHAPTRKQSRTLGEKVKAEQDSFPILLACSPYCTEHGDRMKSIWAADTQLFTAKVQAVSDSAEIKPDQKVSQVSTLVENAERSRVQIFIDKLTPASASDIEAAAFILTFGADVEKKMREAMEKENRSPKDSLNSTPEPPLPVVDMAVTK